MGIAVKHALCQAVSARVYRLRSSVARRGHFPAGAHQRWAVAAGLRRLAGSSSATRPWLPQSRLG